jgi:serine-type D-Ala-D-Ala carboxypeptidase (penicillin-binding protein 5/6)
MRAFRNPARLSRQLSLITGCVAALAVLLLAGLPAAAFQTAAKQAILMEMETGSVLLAKDADTPMPPASMSKLMTLYLLFERLKSGSLSLDDTFLVSEKAWRKTGSKMFVKVGTQVRIEDLIRGIIVQSGNDACIVVAEGIAGTEDAFAELMTRRGKEIGLTGSNFVNSTGWPDDGQIMTARDIAVLSMRMISDFPEYYPYFAEKTFTYSGITQANRNPLLYRNVGADGLKTGHTVAAGYGLAASAKRGERRLILVVNGLESLKQRASESLRMLDWGFRNFKNYRLFKKDELVDKAAIWLGKTPDVPLVIDRDVTITMSREARAGLKATVVYEGPIPAPVAMGQEIARLRLTAPEFTTLEIPLRAGAAVERLGLFGRLWAAVRQVIFGAAG